MPKVVAGARYRLTSDAYLWEGSDRPDTSRATTLRAGLEVTVIELFSDLFVRVEIPGRVPGYVHPLQLGDLLWSPRTPPKSQPKPPDPRVWRLRYGTAAIFQSSSPESAILEEISSADGLVVGGLVRSGNHVFYEVTTASGLMGYVGALNLALVSS